MMRLRLLVLGGCVAAFVAACGGGGTGTAAVHGKSKSPRSTTTIPSATTVTRPGGAQKLGDATKTQVSSILQTALDHYVTAWKQAQDILGSTQYADANAGIAALGDPNSAASRFSSWRKSSGLEQDVNTYLNAFGKADAFYNAKNEPQAIGSWRDDMGQLQSDLAQWVTDAVGWQVRSTSDVQMSQDTSAINTDIAQVTADASATVAAT